MEIFVRLHEIVTLPLHLVGLDNPQPLLNLNQVPSADRQRHTHREREGSAWDMGRLTNGETISGGWAYWVEA